MTSDASGYFDLTFSLGTWTSNTTYLTGEVLCLSNVSGCIPSQGTDVMNGGGGASALLDSSASNWLIWHSWSGSNRVDYTAPTSEANSGDMAQHTACTSHVPRQAPCGPSSHEPRHKWFRTRGDPGCRIRQSHTW